MFLVSYVRKATIFVVRRRRLISPEISWQVRLSFQLACRVVGHSLICVDIKKRGKFVLNTCHDLIFS
jgi:hypothetical protein